MNYPDRMMKSLIFIFANYRQSGGQPYRSLGSLLVYFALLGGNLYILNLLPFNWAGSAVLSGLLLFVSFVCPMFLVWPIVAAWLMHADLKKVY